MQRDDRERESGKRHAGTGYVEDYTTPFLVTAGVLCFVALYAIWSLLGYPVAVGSALLTERFLLR